jgi:2-amino-4-hydroxy-6-hydroxymethyldihydropteridine diphosphokinase
VRVYLSLGSNIGDRADNLRRALHAVDRLEETALVRVSDAFETEPIGPAQRDFLNCAAAIDTGQDPEALLERLKGIERSLGRPPGDRWGPRVIDIDIVLWGDEQRETDRLQVPHPEFRKRAFVLAPLQQIAPEARDPVTGRTVAALAADPAAQGDVRRFGALLD